MRKKRFWNTLSIELLIAITISFSVALLITIFISQWINRYYLVNPNQIGMLKYNLGVLLVFTVIALSFIISFLFLIRKKIKYLKHIIDRVQYIANGKLGSTVVVKGNDELSQLSHNINMMSRELERKFEHERQIEHSKNELITNISHDLRSPLTSILGYLDLLRKKEYKNEEELVNYMERVYSKSLKLKTLIDELFEYTKLTSPDVQLNLTNVLLNDLLEQMTGEYIPIFEKEELSIQKTIPDEDLFITMDVEKMVRVYDNLLTNAKNYSLKPSVIKINLSSDGDKAFFSISNRVEGPPIKEMNKLFERFYRGDQARLEGGGSGLGLAISKRIVELHGGALNVDYKEGWLTFSIEHIVLKGSGLQE
ncbi:HAMP domain-containing histidine kinase [Lederbergia sp. NSJ-179]|uniref:sensor histidine kinase n=1 Tax=Lederbergia sp. NSJ-179 TaxID=2931402 RepID=UPI001FD55548|nr:HAMP domain-containing sensor histidine kinase [Lederbergia sp. NSJ-179]MCJ7841468.1 HAMP domain-containing histidine kinase [Lederbergia sp. NSJ-179]